MPKKPKRKQLVITIKIMRRYLRELTAAADATENGGFGMLDATTVRMYTSAAIEVADQEIGV